nr:hypothetical protein Saspl_052810 [Ipomoea batatas]
MVALDLIAKRRGHGEAIPGLQVSREKVSLPVALIERRERSIESDLLPLVGCINLYLVVVDAHFRVGILGEESELDGGVEEEARRGEVELIDIGLCEGELWLGGVESEPHKEYEGEDREEQCEDGVEDLVLDSQLLNDAQVSLATVFWRLVNKMKTLMEIESEENDFYRRPWGCRVELTRKETEEESWSGGRGGECEAALPAVSGGERLMLATVVGGYGDAAVVAEEMLRWRRWGCGEGGRRNLERRWEVVAGLCCRRWDVGERRGLGCGDAAVVAAKVRMKGEERMECGYGVEEDG